MSIIKITHHDENIYKISEDAGALYKSRVPVYRTKIKKTTPRHATDGRRPSKAALASTVLARTDRLYNPCCIKPHATMGVPYTDPPDPCDYLKKRTGKIVTSPCLHKETTAKPTFTPKKCNTIPTREDTKAIDQQRAEMLKAIEQKNFIVDNMKKVLKMKPKVPDRKVVLERHGESKFLTEGLEPIFIKSKIFSKTPLYLQHFIREQQQAYQMAKDRTGVEQPKCRYITRDEREKLLTGLKHNWEELQKMYQGLPILTDTIPKKMRKSKLEDELKQLEKDIVLMERHSYIYVYEDDDNDEKTEKK